MTKRLMLPICVAQALQKVEGHSEAVADQVDLHWTVVEDQVEEVVVHLEEEVVVGEQPFLHLEEQTQERCLDRKSVV